MKSRVAVTMMLVFGFLISGAGAAVAVSGISGDGSASQFQYPIEDTQGQQAVEGDSATGGEGGSQEAGEEAQAARQVAVTGEDSGLAFTGFLAIPLLLVGVGMAGAGLVLHRAREV